MQLLDNEQIICIKNQQQLNDLESSCCREKIVAIDSEFIRRRTFYIQPSIIQFCLGKQVWILDILLKLDLSPLSRIIENKQIIKVFHSCDEDVKLLYQITGCTVLPIFDTQVAYGLLGKDYPLSYKDIVNQIFNIQLSKQGQLSDWLKRPLTVNQQYYAACDVYYLRAIYDILMNELADTDKLNWVYQQTEKTVIECVNLSKPNNESYRNLKGASRLNPFELGLLKQITILRDSKAIEHDIPKTWVIDNKCLVDIASKGKVEYPDISFRYPKSLRSELTEALTANLNITHPPEDRIVNLHNPDTKIKLKIMQDANEVIATEINVNSNLLFNRKYCSKLLMGKMPTASDWRQPYVGKMFEILAQKTKHE